MIDAVLDWPGSGRNCFEFRMGLEGEAAAAAARKRDSNDAIMLADVVSMLEHLDADHDDGLDADFAFHMSVARAAHNSYYESALGVLRPAIYDGMRLARMASSLGTAAKVAAINKQHRAIYEAILAGNPERARDAMREHLMRCGNSTRHWETAAVSA